MKTKKLKINIRQYKKEDLPFCRILWEQLVDQHRIIYMDPTIGGKNPGRAFDTYLKKTKRTNVFVGEYNKMVIGLAGLQYKDGEAEIDPVIVLKEYRYRGMGTALVEQLTKIAKNKQIKYLSIKPVVRNIDAINFYYKLGYRKIGQVEMFVDLKPTKNQKWKKGLKIFDKDYQY